MGLSLLSYLFLSFWGHFQWGRIAGGSRMLRNLMGCSSYQIREEMRPFCEWKRDGISLSFLYITTIESPFHQDHRCENNKNSDICKPALAMPLHCMHIGHIRDWGAFTRSIRTCHSALKKTRIPIYKPLPLAASTNN